MVGKGNLGIFTILVLLASIGIALALFVHRNTTSISDALATEVLQQQSDVAVLMHNYDDLIIALESERLSSGEVLGVSVEDALANTERQLEAMRFNYSFERLDGASTAHAYVKPVLEDVRQWITTGLPGIELDRQHLISISADRIRARHDKLDGIATETYEVARELIETQTGFLTRFGESLMFLLAAFAMLAAGIASLLARQRDLQGQIAEDQRQYAQRIRDFADTGADWFWEMNSALHLRWLSGRSFSDSSGDMQRWLPAFEHELDERDWPVQQLRKRVGFQNFETQWMTRDGSVKTVSVSGKPLFDQYGEFHGYRGIGKDITVRKEMELELGIANQRLIEAETRGRQQAEQALRDSETFLRTSLNALPQNLAIVNADGIILEANTAWCNYASQSNDQSDNQSNNNNSNNPGPEAGGIGWHVKDIFARKPLSARIALGEVSALIHRVLQSYSTETVRREIRIPTVESTEWVALALSPFQSNGNRYCVLAMEEITDSKQLEERDRRLRAELAHFSRLTTVGELATGLAHELNQPLTAISHNCDALLSGIEINMPLDENDIEAIQSIHDQADRAGAIIKGLRKMVRKETGNPVATDINQLVTETIRLSIADANRHSIEIVLELADGLPKLTIDAVQIQQVLVNLERNGVDAITAAEPEVRKVVISTLLLENDFVRVTVKDSGGGLAESIRDGLFSPFLTTKKDGMGMGLSISRSIVESHGGQLWVDFSDPDMTTFHFSLPTGK